VGRGGEGDEAARGGGERREGGGESWGLARVWRPACSSGRERDECSGEGLGFELGLELSPPLRGEVDGEVGAAGGGGEGGPGSSASSSSSSSSSLYMENSAAMPSVSDAMCGTRKWVEFGGGCGG
jgi:hypothetical protein